MLKGLLQVTVIYEVTPEVVKRLLDDWYLKRARLMFAESFDRCFPKFKKYSLEKPQLQIRKMKKRWGSLSDKRKLILNSDLIKSPKDCIDYVVTHELCHIIYRNHDTRFYQLLERVMPDWEKRKHKLEITMV